MKTKPRVRARSAITGRFMRMANAIRDKFRAVVERIKSVQKGGRR